MPDVGPLEASLAMLQSVAPDLPLVRQLAFEIWALRRLPPRAQRRVRLEDRRTATSW